jgi:hypothetical protein
MLYDPKWEQKTKADPFALESLIAWLEKQPSQRAYDYDCNGHCLLAQYFTAAGFRGVNMGTREFDHGDHYENEEKLPADWNRIAIDHPRTFGAALERAKTAFASAQ